MPPCHCNETGCAADEFIGERHTPQFRNVNMQICEHRNRVLARWLPWKRVDPRGLHVNVGPACHHLPEQAFRHRTPANISGANKEDFFDSAQYAQRGMTDQPVQAFPLSWPDSQDSIAPLNPVSAADHIQALYRLLMIRTGQHAEAERALNETLSLSLQESNRTPGRPAFAHLFQRALEFPVTPDRAPESDLSGWPLALHHLPEPERSALTLFYLEIFSPRELANILGLEIEELARIIGAARRTLENEQTKSNTP